MDDVIDKLREADERTEPPESFDFNAMLRRGRRRTRRRRALQVGSAVASTAAVAIGASLFWPGGSPDSTVADGPEPEEVLGLLSEPQEPEDELPLEVRQDSTSDEVPDVPQNQIVESSSRAVGEVDDARFWAALNESGEICFIGFLDRASWRMSMGCYPPEVFAQQGQTTLVGSPASGVEAWLLPDGYEIDVEEADRWTFVAPNLARRISSAELTMQPEEALSLLGEPQQAEDELSQLPDGREMTGIADSTSRLVYESEDLQVWTGLRSDDVPRANEESRSSPEICVLAYLRGESWSTGMSCAPPWAFTERGVWVTQGGARRVGAWVLPEDRELDDMPEVHLPVGDEASEWTRVNGNLALKLDE